MVAKELILTKHLFCARHMASFLRVQMNLFHAKILQDDHFHLQVRLRWWLHNLSKVIQLVRGRGGI